MPEKPLHPSFERLLDFASRATAHQRAPIIKAEDLRERMDRDSHNHRALWPHDGVSSGTFTNWKTRGISIEGALLAERIFGCSAQWIRTGDGPEPGLAISGDAKAGASHQARENPRAYNVKPTTPVESCLLELVRLLAPADELVRSTISPLVARLINSPDEAGTIVQMVAAVLDANSKRPSAVRAAP